MKSYLKYRALVYDPTANRQWESVNSPAEERLLLTRPGILLLLLLLFLSYSHFGPQKFLGIFELHFPVYTHIDS